jgi:hypothetical protein
MSRSTLISLAVFAGLALATALVHLEPGTSRGMRRLQPGLTVDAIERVVIQGANPMAARRVDGEWRLDDGRRPEPSFLQALLESLARIDSSEVVAEGDARDAEFGVDAAEGLRVEVLAQGGRALAFVLGRAAPGGVYLKAGSETYLVPKVFPYAFNRPAASWRLLRLFEARVDEAIRLEAQPRGQAAYALTQQDGVWSLAEGPPVPAGFRFDPAAGRALAMALVNARAIDLVLEPIEEARTGLAGEVDRFAFLDGQGGRHGLRLGADRDDQGVYAQVEGNPDVFVLARTSVDLLRKSFTDLRDLRVMALDVGQVRRLVIEQGAQRLSLERGEQGWRLAESRPPPPEGFELDPAAVDRRLQALAMARAYGLAPPGTRGRASPERPLGRLVAELEGGGQAALAFGARDKVYDREGVYVRGNADGEVYMLDPATERNLLGGLESLRKVERPPMPAGQGVPQGLEQLPPEVRARLMQQLQGR